LTSFNTDGRNEVNNTNETVVGVFFDEGYAQQAVQALQGAGYQARIADQAAIQTFRSLGWEDEVASLYESRYNEGNSIVVVEGGDGASALASLLQYGAEYINLKGSGGNTGNTAYAETQAYDANYYRNLKNEQRQYGQYDQQMGRARNAEEIRLQLREETLTPVKQAQEAGQVQFRKVVHEDQVEVPVTLRREEVVIERTPVDRAATAAEAGAINVGEDQVISVPVYEETVELQKQTRVREEVTLDKKTVEEQQTVAGTTRREDVELDESGRIRVQGSVDQIALDSDTTHNRTATNQNNA
jgi:uncharacterized protein (TIGR02271 family)